jgi:Na+/H+ antiporter NhaD/arsenite permease-like protein
MGGIVLAISPDPRFLALSCINIVVAANAGGTWSAFGDITSLMVWQAGHLDFFQFFRLFLPAVVTWLVPAICMTPAVPRGAPPGAGAGPGGIASGGVAIVALFALTLATAVAFQNFLALPAVMGMMLGLGYLKILGYVLQRRTRGRRPTTGEHMPLDTFRYVAQVEWDTLLFFYGVILCVGGLATLGYLDLLSASSYDTLGPTTTNVLVGFASAMVDNIPIMAAVIRMSPRMPDGQWLLIALTTGVGGSLLSIGSAAGVALMGQARGHYTFFSHLRWTPAIAAGCAAGVWVHLWVNRALL